MKNVKKILHLLLILINNFHFFSYSLERSSSYSNRAQRAKRPLVSAGNYGFQFIVRAQQYSPSDYDVKIDTSRFLFESSYLSKLVDETSKAVIAESAVEALRQELRYSGKPQLLETGTRLFYLWAVKQATQRLPPDMRRYISRYVCMPCPWGFAVISVKKIVELCEANMWNVLGEIGTPSASLFQLDLPISHTAIIQAAAVIDALIKRNCLMVTSVNQKNPEKFALKINVDNCQKFALCRWQGNEKALKHACRYFMGILKIQEQKEEIQCQENYCS